MDQSFSPTSQEEEQQKEGPSMMMSVVDKRPSREDLEVKDPQDDTDEETGSSHASESSIHVLEMDTSTPQQEHSIMKPTTSTTTTTARTMREKNALIRRLRMIRDQQRRLSARQRVALLVGVLPIVICTLEMLPGKCRICHHQQEEGDVPVDTYFFFVAICGGFGAVIYGSSLDYWMPRLIGGATGALGSLFTNLLLLTSIPTKLAFLLIIFGLLGAMPGLMVYITLKIIADECFTTDDDVEDDEYDEIVPLTGICVVSGDCNENREEKHCDGDRTSDQEDPS